MQAPLFEEYNVDSAKFWNEVNELSTYYRRQGITINRDSIYLNHLITYVNEGILPDLSNQKLFDLGKKLKFYPGLPEFFPKIKEIINNDTKYKQFNIQIEHYIVSTGFEVMIRGSEIAQYCENIWGCTFIEKPARPGYTLEDEVSSSPISQIGLVLDNTSKTRALFEINKGANKYDEIDVNSKINDKDRRVPFSQMIYIADGPSDIPAFSIINQFNGSTYAVYPPKDIKAFRQVDTLRKNGRINMFGEADYEEGSQTYIWLLEHTKQIADQIVRHKENLIKNSVVKPPEHLN